VGRNKRRMLPFLLNLRLEDMEAFENDVINIRNELQALQLKSDG
jgi:hypothetical protein